MSYSKYYRSVKSHNEMAQNAEPTIAKLIRAKRRPNNLPNAWDDIRRCTDTDTKRQIRRSHNSYRDSIRYMIEE